MRLHICVVAELYPTASTPSFTFVDQLVCAMVDQGVQCSVIAPQSITKTLYRKEKLTSIKSTRTTAKGNIFDVYRPYTLTFSNWRIGKRNINMNFSKFVIEKFLAHNNIKPDAFYCHFWHSAYFVIDYAKKFNIPLFIASGESQISIQRVCPNKVIDNISSYLSGVICVSTKNKNESLSLNLAPESKMIVIPNAIDRQKFYKINKEYIRKRFGFSLNDFIVIFVGGFNHRKGPDRVADAISLLSNNNIKSIFIGQGVVKIECDGVLYQGQVPHYEIVNYLNCADVFVLPTLHEGCCNAILEAMACGLPIVSSNGDFNDDILSPKYSIRVDPENISEIATAISFLYKNPVICHEMSNNAFEASKRFEIEQRARKIIKFILQSLKCNCIDKEK